MKIVRFPVCRGTGMRFGGLGEKLYNWFYYLANKDNGEDSNIKIPIKEDLDITRAHDAYVRFNENAELREAYEARQKWQIDDNTVIARPKKRESRKASTKKQSNMPG